MQTPSKQIRLSVALVTRNRPESLERCLKSLRSQSVQPYEVVISDDSDPDFTKEIEAIASRWDCRYIIGPHRGLYANRNHVALACEGTHIRTMDDDHVLPDDHIQQCMEAVLSDPTSIWTTGEIGFINGEYCATAETAAQLYPSGVGGLVTDINNNWAIADGSTIYPREVFDRGHKMVECFPFGSSYLEFGAYLYHHGFRSRCIPGVLIEHYAEPITVTRKNNIKVIKSQLYASICYNFYFKRNSLLGLRYSLSFIRRANFDRSLILSLNKLINMVKERWDRN